MNNGERHSDRKQGAKGPSWSEVLRYWRDLEVEYGHALVLGVTVAEGVRGDLAVRGLLGCPCSPAPYASLIYGDRVEGAPASFPAAVYGALLRADEVLAFEASEALAGSELGREMQNSDSE